MNNDRRPCFECKDRKVGCHSKCKRYKEYKELLEEDRKKIEESQNKEMIAYNKNAVRRIEKYVQTHKISYK